MWRTSTAVPLAAAIVLALLTAGAALAHHNKSYTDIGPETADNDTLTGTPNDDLWEGSPGMDTIRGEGGYDVLGRTRFLGSAGFNTDWGQTDDPGADTYYGGPGKDILEGHGDGSVDTIDCGAGGQDLASFDKGRVWVSSQNQWVKVFDKVDKKTCERLDWTYENLADCAFKPWDNADVKCKTGTNRRDVLLGKDVSDPRIVDAMWGEGNDDTLRGRRGFDGLEGGAGQDTLYGGPGDDTLYGNWYGGPPQGVPPEKNPDELYGEDGDDQIYARDAPPDSTDQTQAGNPDTISCGAGDHDYAVIDIGVDKDPQGVTIDKDGQAGCEIVSNSEPTIKRWWGPKKRRGN
jgi:Ca2+-binding RTX toxin-like protein